MARDEEQHGRRMVAWLIRRNPAYLLSACSMAVGTRLFLVGSADTAGDVALIVTTLVVLQVYEWVVGGILLGLHRSGRSPEDRPSLLLVATIFWTGPMAATVEMIAWRPGVGTALAAGACLLAIAEMRLACRMLEVRLSGIGQAVGAGCVVLLAVVAPLLKMPVAATRLQELYLYGAWWVLGGLALACVGVIRAYRAEARSARAEAWFLAVTLLAVGVQLAGMNYGFFCHARAFYAAPVLVAAAVVGFAAVKERAEGSGAVLGLVGTLPAIAMLLAMQGFDAEVPVERLAKWMRDPLVLVAVIAAAAWVFAYRRHRANAFLHAGCAAIVVAAYRVMRQPVFAPVSVSPPTTLTLLYGATAYLSVIALLLRSRREAIAALVANVGATFALVSGKLPAAGLIVVLTAGWSGLAIVYLASRRPTLMWRCLPIAYLSIAPWVLPNASSHAIPIIEHTVGMVVLLLVAGTIWPWTRYRHVGVAVVLGYVMGGSVERTLRSARPATGVMVMGGFGLLAGGAAISWHKRRLLDAMTTHSVVAPAPPPE